jgi:hypothetical protein
MNMEKGVVRGDLGTDTEFLYFGIQCLSPDLPELPLDRLDGNKPAGAAFVYELDDSRNLREQRIVFSDADVQTGLEFGSSLADKNGSACDQLSGETLYAEPLRVAIAAITRTADSLFMRHTKAPELNRYLIDPDGSVILTMTIGPPILFLAFLLEDNDLFRTIVFHDRTLYRGIGHQRNAKLDIAIVLDQQHFTERDFGTHIAGKLFQPDRLSWRHTVLLSA